MCHCPKIEMIQNEWDKPKCHLMQNEWNGGGNSKKKININNPTFHPYAVNNPTFHPYVVNNPTFWLFYNNLTIVIHFPTMYLITNNK